MSRWHRDHPELVGSSADPWSIHKSYRDAVKQVKDASGDYCRECGDFLLNHEHGLCEECR